MILMKMLILLKQGLLLGALFLTSQGGASAQSGGYGSQYGYQQKLSNVDIDGYGGRQRRQADWGKRQIIEWWILEIFALASFESFMIGLCVKIL